MTRLGALVLVCGLVAGCNSGSNGRDAIPAGGECEAAAHAYCEGMLSCARHNVESDSGTPEDPRDDRTWWEMEQCLDDVAADCSSRPVGDIRPCLDEIDAYICSYREAAGYVDWDLDYRAYPVACDPWFGWTEQL